MHLAEPAAYRRRHLIAIAEMIGLGGLVRLGRLEIVESQQQSIHQPSPRVALIAYELLRHR
jgi:hypothetical protein